MNRRAFLGSLVGGVAATAAVRTWPFRVFSFPAEIVTPSLAIQSIRFIKMYDPFSDRKIARLDVLYGFNGALELPPDAERAASLSGPLGSKEIEEFIKRECPEFPIAIELREKTDSVFVQKAWDFPV